MSILTFVALFRLTFEHFYVTIRGELEVYAEILLAFTYLMKSTLLLLFIHSFIRLFSAMCVAVI